MKVKKTLTLGIALGAFLCASAVKMRAQTSASVPVALPIVFTHGVDASKAKAGDLVTAKTMQVVTLADGTVLPKGTTILGHVTVSRPFTFDSTPYAAQNPSVLSIHFDALQTKTAKVPVVIWVRALADSVSSQSAVTPRHVDEERDVVGYMVQIGGDSFRRDQNLVYSPDGDVVEYNRKHGTFARLLPGGYANRYSHFDCEGSGVTEESVAIFSADACGLYGFGDEDAYLADNGQGEELGTFSLASRHHTVKLYTQSTALLETRSLPDHSNRAVN